MNLILAVLEKRAGYFFSNCDTYINVVGGLRLDEPAVDLAVAMSLVSSLKDTAISENAIAFGEIGLAGEIRGVSQSQARISEAVRLGFRKIVLPYQNVKTIKITSYPGVDIVGVKNIREAFEHMTN